MDENPTRGKFDRWLEELNSGFCRLLGQSGAVRLGHGTRKVLREDGIDGLVV